MVTVTRTQFRALLTLQLRQSLRRYKVTVKTRIPPFAWLQLAYLIFGIVAAFMAWASSRTSLVAMATVAVVGSALISAFTMINELQHLLISKEEHEIVAALPLPRSALLLAKAATLVVLALASALSFATPTWLLGIFVLGFPLSFAPLLPVQVALAALSSATTVLCIVLLLLAPLPPPSCSTSSPWRRRCWSGWC